MKIGDKYHCTCEGKDLVYVGWEYFPNGVWHNFAELGDESKVPWLQIREHEVEDLLVKVEVEIEK